jgi:hypothetical protein
MSRATSRGLGVRAALWLALGLGASVACGGVRAKDDGSRTEPASTAAGAMPTVEATGRAEPTPSAEASAEPSVRASSAATVAASAVPSASSAAGDAYPEPFEQGDKWGYRRADGKVVIAPQFLTADPFSATGLGLVSDAKGPAIIEAHGHLVLRPFVLDEGPDPFTDGLARYVEGGKIGYYDDRGRIVIRAAYDFGMPFENGRAAVCSGCSKQQEDEHYRVVGGVWWEIDRRGQKLRSLEGPPRR